MPRRAETRPIRRPERSSTTCGPARETRQPIWSSAASTRRGPTTLSRHPLAQDPHQQPARTDHARDPSTDSCCRRIPRWPVVPQPRRRTIALHRGDRMVGQMLYEHAAALSAAGRANRSRRLIKCAKDCGHYHGAAYGLVFVASRSSMKNQQSIRAVVNDYPFELDVGGCRIDRCEVQAEHVLLLL